MNKRDYIKLAEVIRTVEIPQEYKKILCEHLGNVLQSDNHRFSVDKWKEYITLSSMFYPD